MVLPVFVVVVLFFALLIAYPWEVLTVGTVLYLASLPFGWLAYRDYERKHAATHPEDGDASEQPLPTQAADNDERPARLN